MSGVGNGKVADMRAPQCAEVCATTEFLTNVVGQGSDVSAFAHMYLEIDLVVADSSYFQLGYQYFNLWKID